jgi:hypothetical protein
VRKALREQPQAQTQDLSERDVQTLQQIVSKYVVSEEEVKVQYKACDYDWACARAYFREQFMSNKETGKPDKK